MDKLELCRPFLHAIRKHEAPKGYGQIYSGAKGVSLATDVSKLTIDGVLAFQAKMLKGGSRSTACGGYQFLKKTLTSTKQQMGLSGKEVWTPELQDRMAMHLMECRGLTKYLGGVISLTTFANNLAKEWASLPVVSTIKGDSRTVSRGQSYYAGDGLNKAFHDPAAIEWFLDQMLKPQNRSVTVEKPVPAPDALKTDVPAVATSNGPQKPSLQKVMVWIVMAIVAAIAALFGLGGQ